MHSCRYRWEMEDGGIGDLGRHIKDEALADGAND
jgi:hypothetical protein